MIPFDLGSCDAVGVGGSVPVSRAHARLCALMSEVETRRHAQAADAATATGTPSRTHAYGTLLAICAHAAHHAVASGAFPLRLEAGGYLPVLPGPQAGVG
jgi:hypothetical protein